MRQHSGFTLIELLTVCAVLAAVSYVAWGAYTDVDRRAENDLAQTSLMRLATALKRFHDDTGYWPGEGPFQPSRNCEPDGVGAIDPSSLPGMGDRWFQSPANLSLLFEPPVLCEGHKLAFLEQWNAQTRRGWNGPYLPLNLRHWVVLEERLGDIPAFGTGPDFTSQPEGPDCADDLNDCALIWRTIPSHVSGFQPERHQMAHHARPFLFLLDPPRVVYWGMDGRFGGTSRGDRCLPNVDNPYGTDDSVICL